MNTSRIKRRIVLRSLLATWLGWPALAAAQTPQLDEKDPQALTLGYVANAAKVDVKKNPTYKPGQTCANCVLLTGKEGDAFRPCAVFPGKLVAAAGWCRSWVKRG
jgi:hypothetical protein